MWVTGMTNDVEKVTVNMENAILFRDGIIKKDTVIAFVGDETSFVALLGHHADRIREALFSDNPPVHLDLTEV